MFLNAYSVFSCGIAVSYYVAAVSARGFESSQGSFATSIPNGEPPT